MVNAAAFIFPGQGVQYPGMGKDLYENYPTAQAVFDEADQVLDIEIIKLCFEGPQDQLTRTSFNQPAVLTTSIASLRALEMEVPNIAPKATCGLSLGEYAALVAAGSLKFRDAVQLVRKRGQFMEAASRRHAGTMASILGLPREEVEDICKKTHTTIANLNCPGQIVISGMKGGISTAIELAKRIGAKKAILLNVNGPFHSPFMDSASQKLKRQLEKTPILPPKVPVVSNITADYQTEPEQIRRNLADQVNHSCLWEESIRLLSSKGIFTYLEIGPGRVLKGLLRRIDPSLIVHNIETAQDIASFAKKI